MEVMRIFNRKLIMLSILMVALLAVSAVSASDNITDVQAIDNATEEPVCEIDNLHQDVLTTDEGSDALEKSNDFTVDIYKRSILIANPFADSEDMGKVSCPDGAIGNLSLSVGNDVIHTYELAGNASTIRINYNDFKLPFGQNTMKIHFVNETGTKQIYSGRISVDYYMEIFPGSDSSGLDAIDFPLFTDNRWLYHVDVPKNADGKLFVSFDGRDYEEVTYTRKWSYVTTASLRGLSIGTHSITARLVNDSYYPNKTVEYTFSVCPKITAPAGMAVGEREYILIDLPDNYNGTVRIFKGTPVNEDGIGIYYIKGDLIATADAGSHVKIPIPALNIGENTIYVNLTGSGDYEDFFYMDYYPNDPRFSSSISSTEIELGGKVTLTINAPISDTNLYVYVDGVEYDCVDLDGLKAKMSISRLGLGQHHIKLEYCVESYDDDCQRTVEGFYSNSFYVTVKPATSKPSEKTVIVLKEIKIKKSAKKLILQATLKKAGKVLSGKKITFKFNGVKYTAKTNKKGVAKVAIAKKVLKKLKVGKKVKYQASYGKITVKKTAKVKK